MNWKKTFREKWSANSDWVDKERTEHSQDYVVFDIQKVESFIESLIDEKGSDLVSNCCAWEFYPWGIEKEEGVWQERCLKCGKLCEPLYISETDIKNIHRLFSFSSQSK